MRRRLKKILYIFKKSNKGELDAFLKLSSIHEEIIQKLSKKFRCIYHPSQEQITSYFSCPPISTDDEKGLEALWFVVQGFDVSYVWRLKAHEVISNTLLFNPDITHGHAKIYELRCLSDVDVMTIQSEYKKSLSKIDKVYKSIRRPSEGCLMCIYKDVILKG